MRLRLMLCCAPMLLAQSLAVLADEPVDAAAAGLAVEPAAEDALPVTLLDAVEVSGIQPGPGLWRVTDPESGHVLVIVGSHTPVPRRIQWEASEALGILAGSGAVIAPARVSVDSGVGRLRGLTMLPSLMRARRNPGDQALSEVMPEALYARWERLKAEYLGRSRKVERWRPLFAARELFEEALKRARLTDDNPVWPVVRREAERLKVPVLRPAVEIKIDAPRELIRDFAQRTLDDLPCMEATLDLVEHHMPALRLRADAWAVGAIDLMRGEALPPADQLCLKAMLGAAPEDRDAFADLPGRVRAAWLETAVQALDEHPQTLAVVSIGWLLDPAGPLQALADRGYEIQAPAQ